MQRTESARWLAALIAASSAACGEVIVLDADREAGEGSEGGGAAAPAGQGGGSAGAPPGEAPPVPPEERKIDHVDLGMWTTCASLESGHVYCWGMTDIGGSPDYGDKVMKPSPTFMPELTNVAQISLGQFHACALKKEGHVLCWGENHSGQLGLGYEGGEGLQQVVSTPTPVPGVSGVVQVEAGYDFTCARHGDGTVTCWNGSGLSKVPELDDAMRVTVGHRHACAVRADASVVCWGRNDQGQLAPATSSTPVKTPLPIPGLGSVVEAVGMTNATCALAPDGRVDCWGGDVGPEPTWVPGLEDVVDLAGGVALHADGHVSRFCADGSCPVLPVSGATGMGWIEGGRGRACGFKNERLYCWGGNEYGQLGAGDFKHHAGIVEVDL